MPLLHFATSLKTSHSIEDQLNQLSKLGPQGVYTGPITRNPPCQLPPPTVKLLREPGIRIVVTINDPVNKPEDVMGYEVYDKTNRRTYTLDLDARQLTLQWPKISHGCIYTFRVCAFNGAGKGQWSDKSRPIDLSDFPPPPSIPSISSLRLEVESEDAPRGDLVLEFERPPEFESFSGILISKASPTPSQDIPPRPARVQEEPQQLFPMSVDDSRRSPEPGASGSGPALVAPEGVTGPASTVHEDQSMEDFIPCSDIASNGSCLSARLPGFTRDTRCILSIKAVGEGGEISESSNNVRVPRPDPGRPCNVCITEREHNRVTLSWTHPGANYWAVESYVVQSSRAMTTWKVVKTVERDKTMALVVDLEPDSEYFLRVCSVSSVESVPSEEVRTRTKSHPSKRAAKAAFLFTAISVGFPVSVPIVQGYLSVKKYKSTSEEDRGPVTLAAVDTAGEMAASFFLSPILFPITAWKMAEQVYSENNSQC